MLNVECSGVGQGAQTSLGLKRLLCARPLAPQRRQVEVTWGMHAKKFLLLPRAAPVPRPTGLAWARHAWAWAAWAWAAWE